MISKENPKVLYWEKFQINQAVGKELLDYNLEWRAILDLKRKVMVLNLKAEILSDKLPTRVITKGKYYHKQPKTWWDHFKLQYKNKWWIKPLLWYYDKRNLAPWQFDTFEKIATVNVKIEPRILFPEMYYSTWLGKPVKHYSVSHEGLYDNPLPNYPTTRSKDSAS